MNARRLQILLLLAIAAGPVGAERPVDHGRAGLLRLREKHLAVWPHFDWTGTRLEDLLAARLRPGDYVVCSSGIGLKDGFRADDYRIDRSRVLLHIETPPGREFFASEVDRKQNGIGGLLVLWENRNVRFGNHDKRLRQLDEECERRRFQLRIGMSHTTGRYAGNIEAFADYADVVSIGFERAAIVSPEEAAEYYLRTAQRVRRSAGRVAFDAVIPLPLEGANLDALGRLVELLADDFESFTFEFNDKAGQIDTIAAILEIARGFTASESAAASSFP